jgi:hypothetical protein
MRYAEIFDNKVRFISESDTLPFFNGPISVVEIPEGVEVMEGYTLQELFVGEEKKIEFHPQSSEKIFAEHRPSFNAERSRRFSDTQWIRQRHADRMELGIEDKANWSAWLIYWQALRDMPQLPEFDPRTPAWPEAPK